ncbi:Serine/threonine protein kinase [Stygiomarasmius scandens]|uniref:Serine/threonine protein kinase n=1 Tax=Marasmiellus scandens TaxID=2682957 RepID=A0ABR1ITE2_9AGAR
MLGRPQISTTTTQASSSKTPPAALESFAVKAIKKVDKNTNPLEYYMQKRELKLHQTVSSHTNVVSLYHSFNDADSIYLVLEFCVGGDLHNLIFREKLFMQQDNLIKSCFGQILQGLYHCHQLSVFHRDIKPSNILCSGDWSRYMLADFGLATDQLQSTDWGCGTLQYMSPSVQVVAPLWTGKAYSTTKSDIWSSKGFNFIEGRASLFTSGSVEQEVVDLVAHILRLQPVDRIGSVSTLISRFSSLQALYKPKIPSPFIDHTSAGYEQASIASINHADNRTNDNDTDHEEEYSEDDGDTIKLLSSVESESFRPV